MVFGGAAALVRFLEQMRGVCFIIESRSDSLCLFFGVSVSVWEGGTQISVIFLSCGLVKYRYCQREKPESLCGIFA